VNDDLASTRASQPRIVTSGAPTVPVGKTIAFGLGGFALGFALVAGVALLKPKPAAEVAQAPARVAPIPVAVPAEAVVPMPSLAATPPAAPPKLKPSASPFAALDAVYAAWKEPPPPSECRRAADADRLATAATDRSALGLIDPLGPEAAYLLARATFTDLKIRSPALETALGCPGFAAAELLAGNLALANGSPEEARTHFTAAVREAPHFLEARAKLAGLLAKQGKLDEALVQSDAIVAADPSYAAAWLVRAAVEQKQGKNEAFLLHMCKAVTLGSAQAKSIATQLKIACPPSGAR
jgi:hypothetical protein